MKEKKFHRSTPHLPVRNLQETLDFYRDKPGFYEEWTWEKMMVGSGGMICGFFLEKNLGSLM